MYGAATPPIITAGAVVSTAPADGSAPSGNAGLVGPNPVPHRMITSPGLAATVPATRAGSPIRAPSGLRVAMAQVPLYMKNAGENGCMAAVAGSLACPLLVTTTLTGP